MSPRYGGIPTPTHSVGVSVGDAGGVPFGDLFAPVPQGAAEPVGLGGQARVLELLGDLVDGESAEFGVVDAVDAPEGFFGVPGVADLAVGSPASSRPSSFASPAPLMRSWPETSSLRALYSGSCLWPRWPRVWFWTLRRTSSSALLASFTTWNGSATCFA